MNYQPNWLINLGNKSTPTGVDGLVFVKSYDHTGRPPEEIIMIEKAREYRADAVFFEAPRSGRPAVAQAFVYFSYDFTNDEFAAIHKRLWNWGGVPLAYRKKPALIELYRCAHKPDFVSSTGKIVSKPRKKLKLAAQINAAEPWWNANLLRNGTLWDNPNVCSEFLSSHQSAHRALVDAVANLYTQLQTTDILNAKLRRRLLILSLLTAYLEERKAFTENFFSKYVPNAVRFFEVLSNGPALVQLLRDLEAKFNGHVFSFNESELAILERGEGLGQFATLIEAQTEANGQLTLWQLYSFKDLPVEVISHIYQLFVDDSSSSIYTPPFLVRLILDEVLSFERIDRLISQDEVILDPACGSGVFLVEAYKRLVLHWRAKNDWKNPGTPDLQKLIHRVHGVDLDKGAVELTAFSLCLSLCDALQPEAIRASIGLFPLLMDKTIHHSCFFEAKNNEMLSSSVGVIVGNPPFKSKLDTDGAQKSYDTYNKNGLLPDRQLAYLFLHESMEVLNSGGVIGMLQGANFLYNLKSKRFRQTYFGAWNVREILDFVSVRGLFKKGDADTKVVAIVAEATLPKEDTKILHATFRRTGRTNAHQEFDLDYYDLNWVSQSLTNKQDGIWKANLLGGVRVADLVKRLSQYRSLSDFSESQGWDYGEGFIAGSADTAVHEASYISGQKLLPTTALTENGINLEQIEIANIDYFASPRSEGRYAPPLLLIKEHMDLHHDVWLDSHLAYKARIVGFSAPQKDKRQIQELDKWISEHKKILQAFIAGYSPSLFVQKATAICADEIYAIPYPENGNLELSENENIIATDIVNFYRDFVRFGEDSKKKNITRSSNQNDLKVYDSILTKQINSVYSSNPLNALGTQRWPGVVCQSYVFGDGELDWEDTDEFQIKLNSLLKTQIGSSLNLTRIARIYDGKFIHCVKPESLRFWLKSIALRDADEIMSDLRNQGF